MRSANKISVFGFFSILALGAYLILFWRSVSFAFFNDSATTDDAFQQVFPFNEVLVPGRFSSDLTYQAMRGYLMPLHWLLGAVFTRLCGDAVMASQCMTILQYFLLALFIWLSVRKLSHYAVANFALIWLFHSRILIDRLAGGLPRGWLGVISATIVWAIVCDKPKFALLIVCAAPFLSPPAAALSGLTFGGWLLYKILSSSDNKIYQKALLQAGLILPLVALVTLYCIKRPDSVGPMVSLSVASKMPDFQRGTGRFKLLPFASVLEDLSGSGMRAFVVRPRSPDDLLRRYALAIVLLGMAGLSIAAGVRSKKIWEPGLIILWASSFAIYLLAREFAFYLYVPNRYLLFPWAVFFIVSLPSAVWNFCEASPGAGRDDWRGMLSLLLIGVFVWRCDPKGLDGRAGFSNKRPDPDFYRVIDQKLPPDAVLAGNPEAFPGVPLYSKRRLLVSSEVSHPFYPVYYAEMTRRLKIAWASVYARSRDQFVDALKKEGVGYFIFKKSDYTIKKLGHAVTFQPLGAYVKNLSNFPGEQFFYTQLMKSTARDFVVYEDKRVVLVDLSKL